MKTKIVILSYFPIRHFYGKLGSQILDVNSTKNEHSIPWVDMTLRYLVSSKMHEVHLITLSDNIRESTVFCHNGLHVHIFKKLKRGRSLTLFYFDFVRILKRINEIGANLVHCFGAEDAYAIAAVKSKKPSVVTIQMVIKDYVKSTGQLLHRNNLIIKRVEKYVMKRAENVIAKNPYAITAFRDYLKLGPAIYYLENPVSDVYFDVRRNETDKRILFVGRIEKEKGMEELISAFISLARVQPDASLRIVGSGCYDYIAKIKEKLQRNNVLSRVEFVGYLDKMALSNEYSRASLLILPTYHDSSPNVISEGMAAGLPIVATNVGGISYLLRPGDIGLLCNPKDPLGLAEAILSLLKDETKRRFFGENARNAALKRHTPGGYFEKLLTIYEDILSRERTK